ncbi:MAG: 5'/3'-nucleotidase SurE, partial [Paracoccaceae bacterium]
MRILITNDDGINAPGLKALEQIAYELAGDTGEVWVIAPTQERSGVAHCISYTSPMLINKISERRYSVDGYPADCVLAGLYHIMPERPDVILSGVNRGNNSAENVLYSGTIGAALEGALQGIKSFALSQYLGPKNYGAADPFEASHVHGTDILRDLIAREYDNPSDYHIFYNI